MEPPQRLHGGRAAAASRPLAAADETRSRSSSSLLAAALIIASFAVGAETPPANELGRVMILEYHKIDYPEERWTRTPENFRRDLERLYARGYRLVRA